MNKLAAWIVIFFVLMIMSAVSVAAVECGSTPTDGCEVTQDTTFVPGTYNLPNGISIQADNVELDCNGALINGSNLDTKIGLTLRDIQNITIENCRIRNYNPPSCCSAGIWGHGGVAITIRNVDINQSYAGVIMNGTGSRQVLLENISVDTTRENGFLLVINDSIVRNIVVRRVGYNGVHIAGWNNLVENSTFLAPGEGSSSIRVSKSKNLILRGNLIVVGPPYRVGISLIPSGEEYIEDVRIFGNTLVNAGVYIDGTNTLLLNNHFNNTEITNVGINTTLCSGGVFNKFTGFSQLVTRTWIDIDPSCVWNLPAGMNLDHVENATFDCRGALINGSNLETRGAISMGFARNITIENCRVQNYRPETENCCFAGIDTSDTEDVTLRNIDVNYTQIGILLNGSGARRVLLENVSVDQIARDGMNLVRVNDSTLRGIVIHHTGDNGINIAGERNVIEDSLFTQGIPSSHILSFFANNLTIRNNAFRGREEGWTAGVLLLPFEGMPFRNIEIVDNEFHNAFVEITPDFPDDPLQAFNTIVLNNLFNNSGLRNGGANTILCRNGTFNRFVGESGITTSTQIDIDPSCVWNLPGGFGVSGIEDVTFDCHGALINGTNEGDGAGMTGWEGLRNVTIQNCTIMNYNPPEGFGGGLALSGDDITIKGNTIDNTMIGVIINVWQTNNHIVIEDNMFIRTRGANLLLAVEHSVIRGNTFLEYTEWGGGLNLYGKDTLVENNFFNGSIDHIQLFSYENVTIRDNVFRGRGTETTAIRLWDGRPMDGLTIADNDIRDASLVLPDYSDPEITHRNLVMVRNTLENVGRVDILQWNDTYIAFNNITADSVNFLLTGSSVEHNDFTGGGSTVSISGDSTVYAGNIFNDSVLLSAAFNNTFTNNTFANASFVLDSTTAENLLYENIFSGTQIGDAGVNNRWCKDNTKGNAYALGARYLGNDPKGGKCNAPPYFAESLSDKLVQVAERLYLRALCRDLENDTVTYSDNATEFDIGRETGLIDWTPGSEHVGSRRVEVTCSDPFGSVSQSFKITVK